jgi:hypothetical protein
VRCGRCGNENSEINRFCGMCGAPLLPKGSADTAARVPAPKPAAAPVQPPPQSIPRQQPLTRPVELSSVTTQRPAVPLSSSPAPPFSSSEEPSVEPTITGPSFLGLNRPASTTSDPSSSSVHYLLEDDEEEPKRAWGKFALLVVALALGVGLGYLHWKQGGFPWLNGQNNQSAATTADGSQSGTDSPSSTPAANPSPATPSVATPQSGSTADGNSPAPAAATTSPAPSNTSQATPLPSPLPGSAPDADSQTAAAPPAPSPSAPPASSQTTSSPAVSADSGAPAESDSGGRATPDATPTPKPALHKPSPAKPVAAKPLDAVTEAERYINGRGVPQNCDRGLRMLKTAAEQSNAGAMISLGALYSTGSCTPRDLPTSYRWFALALHKEPNDQALQDDLQKLWSQMTPAERQLAIKLSQ